MYFPYKYRKGILRYIYKNHRRNYGEYVKYNTSFPVREGWPISNAFDFNDSSYWITDDNAPNNNYFEFCLPHHVVKITGYEIFVPNISVDGSPHLWGFQAGNDSINENISNITVAPGASQYVDYYIDDFFQCFRYINKGWMNRGTGYRSRISQIEIYGYLYGDGLGEGTCKVRHNGMPKGMIIIIIIIICS